MGKLRHSEVRGVRGSGMAELGREASSWGSMPRAHGVGLEGDGGQYSHGAPLFVPDGTPAPEAGSTHQWPASDACSLANSPV